MRLADYIKVHIRPALIIILLVAMLGAFTACADMGFPPASTSQPTEPVVAFGATDEIQGQAVEIAVTGHDGEPLDEAALLRFCRKHMPAYMVPRAVHLWPGEMPRTGSGKVDRRTITQQCIQRSPNA